MLLVICIDKGYNYYLDFVMYRILMIEIILYILYYNNNFLINEKKYNIVKFNYY